ncbi:MAG: methyl-accepting chemotaxis protein [Desulfobacteraceae bacterium]|nr:MAG: methyl-accepting chemotaxis protein [Desulfobacteraceae bacterium]
MKKHSSLARQMLIYFGFIAVAALLITVEFVWAVRIIMSQAQAMVQLPAGADGIAHILTALRTLQEKAFLIGIVQALVTLIVLVMLIRRITDPLQHMIEKARRISEGDLSRTIRVHRRDEIGLLAETINGLTSNIQEIVAFGMSTEASLQASLKGLRDRVKQDPIGCAQMEKMEKTLGGFGALLEGFQLLPAPPTDT